MNISTDIGIWVSLILTLMAYSFFLYKDTPFFKFAEITLSATAAAHVLVISLKLIYDGALNPLAGGSLIYVVPILLGCILYTRYSKKYGYASRWTLAVMIGTGLGLVTRAIAPTDIVGQIVSAGQDQFLNVPIWTTFDSVVVLFATVTTVFYFFLTLRHRGPTGSLSKVGRGMIMVMLGAAFGNTVWTRFAWFIARIQFILGVFGL